MTDILLCAAFILVLGLGIHEIQAGASDDEQDPGDPVHAHTNRLIEETSPYLLQHAHNPVDWHPWGAESIELARREGKPIFLSIGYSTCYWCHVMERESFESEATAALMNRDFVCIKVDREQRPDVDEIYMTSCQVFTRMTTGQASGGWPLSVFIDSATLKPYFVGTYFPPTPSAGRPSFSQVLEGLAAAWKDQRDAVTAQADQIAARVSEALAAGDSARGLGADEVRNATDRLMTIHDREHGGFGTAPKFPQPVFLELLFESGWDREPVRQALALTLDRMATGGMYDQVGGGFHRYSTDERWLVPHFEKMLYDNGQLASVYAESYARTGDEYHARIARETVDYVLKEMTDPGTGAFYSAQDAEVNTHEGENYLWNEEELASVLEAAGLEDDVALALRFFGLDQGPNFQDPHHRELPPTNVLFMIERPDVFAESEGLSSEEMDAFLARIRAALYEARAKRDQPGLDDKLIVAWNGLMIMGMADAGRVLDRQDYVDAAARAARHILTSMRDEDGALMRTARNGRMSIPAFLEDYAFLARGLIALHDASGDPSWLEEAASVVEAARIRFWGEDGAWYDTLENQADLFVRSRSTTDGAVPSGIGTMLLVVQAMGERTGEEWYLDDLQSALNRLSEAFAANPLGSTYATIATARALMNHPDRLPRPESARKTLVGVSIEPEPLVFRDGLALSRVVIEIAEGFHINAHLPGDPDLIGMGIRLEGVEGLDLAVDYPEGDLYRESIRVHARRVEVPIEIRRTGVVSGSAALVVSWQACDDQVCLAPDSIRIPIVIEAEKP